MNYVDFKMHGATIKIIMGGCSGEGRSMRKPTGRWEYAIWSDNHRFAPDTDLESSSKEQRKE